MEFTQSQCSVLEDADMSICGYVVTCPDVSQYYSWFDESWLPSIKDKCPKLSAADSDSEVRLIHLSSDVSLNGYKVLG